jgi:hypothetical protein
MELIYVVILLAVVFGVFVILRGIMLWYYKIDERILLLRRNNQLLEQLVKYFTGNQVPKSPEKTQAPDNPVLFTKQD